MRARTVVESGEGMSRSRSGWELENRMVTCKGVLLAAGTACSADEEAVVIMYKMRSRALAACWTRMKCVLGDDDCVWDKYNKS